MENHGPPVVHSSPTIAKPDWMAAYSVPPLCCIRFSSPRVQVTIDCDPLSAWRILKDMSRFSSIVLDPGVIRRLKKGDRKAQEVTYRAFANAVYTLARRVLRDPAAAEEVMQDTFVDVMSKAHSLARDTAFPAWVRSIAMNHCLMRLRSPWYRRREALERDERSTASDATDRAVDVDQALAKLSSTARMVVWMHCIEGFTHEEIGRAFGYTASFSKTQLARAYSALADARFGATEQNDEPATNRACRA